jgi:L-cystine transport system permease protein
MRALNIEKIFEYLLASLPYLRFTFYYVLLSLLVGTLIGTLLVVLKNTKNVVAKGFVFLYMSIIRCLPPVVLLFITYYGIPAFLRGVFHIEKGKSNPLIYVCVTFSLLIGASSSEIIRSALNTVGSGQLEAGYSVGLTRLQAYRKVIIPQMIKCALPNLANTVVYLFKEGSLGYTINVIDVFGKAMLVSSMDLNSYIAEVYLALTLVYWPISALIQWIFKIIEKNMDYTGGRENEY